MNNKTAIRVWTNYNGTCDLTQVDPNHGHTLRHISSHADRETALKARDQYLRQNRDAVEF